MRKIAFILFLCLVYVSAEAQNLVVESGSPALSTESTVDLILSDPSNFNYTPGSSTYNVFIEKDGTSYYTSYNNFNMTNVGSGVYVLGSTVTQQEMPPEGTYDVRVYDSYYGTNYSCSNCFTFNAPNTNNLVVESGSPALNSESTVDLVLSDPSNFYYSTGSGSYDVFIEKDGTSYYASYSSFTVTNVGSGVYELSSTVSREEIPAEGTYDVRVHDTYTGSEFNCSDCFTFNCTDNTGTDVVTACDSFIWIDGITYYTDNNTATFTLTNMWGCDSLVTLNLTINTVDVTVTDNSPTLTANQAGAEYQWIDCNNNNEPIADEINQDFTATENGSYAVIVTYNDCTDTSECITVTGLDVNAVQAEDYKLYPNPARDMVYLEFGDAIIDAKISVSDIYGRQIYLLENQSGSLFTIPIEGLSGGLYFIHVQDADKTLNIKLIKE